MSEFPMSRERWDFTCDYLENIFGKQDDQLAGVMTKATAAGLPDIAVNAEVGRLLMMLTSMTRGQLAIEVGTLAGYSGTWIARGLKPGGKLYTIELIPKHAEFAAQQFENAGVADRVEIVQGPAIEMLPELAERFGPASVDVIFLDAVKSEYPNYWEIVRPLIAPGGLILADNVLGSGSWWIDNINDPTRNAADRFNHLVAGDKDFESVTIPLRQGVLMGRRKAE